VMVRWKRQGQEPAPAAGIVHVSTTAPLPKTLTQFPATTLVMMCPDCRCPIELVSLFEFDQDAIAQNTTRGGEG
jgi:hypothetical protein